MPRQLVTGAHLVGDVSCQGCHAVLGWKYVGAADEAQRYKVGNFILETKRLVRDLDWEDRASSSDDDDGDAGGNEEQWLGYETESDQSAVSRDNQSEADAREEIEFDSQNDDECEDLFAGVWSPALAARRRAVSKAARCGDNVCTGR